MPGRGRGAIKVEAPRGTVAGVARDNSWGGCRGGEQRRGEEEQRRGEEEDRE